MKLIALLILVCSGFVQDTPDLQRTFDDKKTISTAVEVLIDHCDDHGSANLEKILYKGVSTELIRDFATGLQTFKTSAESGYDGARSRFVVREFGPEKQAELAKDKLLIEFLERYLRQMHFTTTTEDVKKYLEAGKATKVGELVIPMPDAASIHWYLFFRTENKKWRLDQALPYFENLNALRGVFNIFFIDFILLNHYHIRVRGYDMKLFALLAIVGIAQAAASQTNQHSLRAVELSYQPTTFARDWQEKIILFSPKLPSYKRSCFDLDSWNWQFGQRRDATFSREFLRRDYGYKPDLGFRIGDGLFGGSVIHGNTWSGRTEPRYIELKFMGIIPIGRARVNGG